MRVLGFDPGTATTGYGVVEKRGNRLVHLAHGTITTPAGEHFATRLQQLHDGCEEVIREYEPEEASIEKLYFVQNVTTGIAVAQARGVIALACARAELVIGEYTPLETKNAVTGYGKADKKQVQEMVKILLNLDAIPKPDDAADGLALAICHLNARQVPRAAGEG